MTRSHPCSEMMPARVAAVVLLGAALFFLTQCLATLAPRRRKKEPRKMMNNVRYTKHGITLIELIIVLFTLAVIGLLCVFAVLIASGTL